MSTQVIERVEGEDSNLALHVQLCEQRYIQLITKLDQVDSSLNTIQKILSTITAKLEQDQNSKLRMYLGWSGVIIVSLLGGLITAITR